VCPELGEPVAQEKTESPVTLTYRQSYYAFPGRRFNSYPAGLDATRCPKKIEDKR
jgi:hypothetical protein